MIRRCQAIVIVQKGKGHSTQYRVQRVESYTTEESMDQDADSFTISIGDPSRELEACLDRDNEVRVNLFINDARGNLVPIFTGLADSVDRDQNYLLNITGRDLPSSLAVDTDALPQRWKHLPPKTFIEQRAHTIGISATQIAKMSPFKSIFTDGSETEWAFWYRIARMREAYIWTNHLRGGTLIIDKLGYSLSPSYLFGDPPRGQARNNWQPVEAITQTATKQGRKRRVIIYGATAKKGKKLGRALVSQAVDITIPNWKKQSVQVLTSTVDKTADELHKRAGIEVFEAIVGAVEWQLTIHDTGQLIQQNKMCRINMPHYMPVGNYFIVGVTRQGDSSGMTQVVRVREKGFALSKRIPDPPVLAKTKTSTPDDYIPAASIAGSLQGSGIRWGDYFVRATREFGDGWDFAVFLGALLSICEKETGFRNIRQTTSGGPNNIEWYEFKTVDPPTPAPKDGGGPVGPRGPIEGSPPAGPRGPVDGSPTPGDRRKLYSQRFANEPTNPDNPMAPNQAGVGPMQITDQGAKDDADGFGWNEKAKAGELDGGRWNPASNIRAAARLLFQKGQINPPTNPLTADQIWINVQRYNGSGPAAEAYAAEAKKLYNERFEAIAVASVAAAKALPPGTTDTTINIPGHGIISLPDNTPDTVRKALAFALRHLGDFYQTAGSGNPGYDCSSFVTAALAAASGDIKSELDYPYPGHHGETTITLFKTGRFNSVDKDQLRPGDLVFFVGDSGTPSAPGHVGMYIDDHLFIHDPQSGEKVNVAGLGEDYWTQNYVGARRVIPWTIPGGLAPVGSVLTKVGPYEVEAMLKPGGGTVDQTKPAMGVLHTTEGATFTGALNTLDSNEDWPTFMVGVEASGACRIGQFYSFGEGARALQHTADPPTNNWARAQIEIVGFSQTTAWQPSDPTFSHLAALLAALSRPPWNIPLSRPAGWGDTYDVTGTTRRTSGVWGTQSGWYGHIEIPENTHVDPGALTYSALFSAAGGF